MTLIKPQTLENLKQLWVRIALSRTDKVTKVTEGSVLSGIAYADAKLSQKALKDIALAQSHFYPDTAHGQFLDNIAKIYGISPRFGALASSTYVRIKADVGTSYIAGTHVFKSQDGLEWSLSVSVTVGTPGFTYALVSTTTTGAASAVEPFVINAVAPIPVGHTDVTNEFQAVGGRDIESDDVFRIRIKEAINALARPTRNYLKQAMLKFNQNVLRVYNYGDNGLGKTKLAIATINGADLTPAELNTLTTQITPFLSLSEEEPDGLIGVAVELVNIEWEPIDISFRANVDTVNFDVDTVRTTAQIRVNKYLDYRIWESGGRIEWDDLLQIVKTTPGIIYVPDDFFFPGQDIITDNAKLPRIRGFQMLDINGTIISNSTGVLNPIFYPTIADFSLIQTVLANL